MSALEQLARAPSALSRASRVVKGGGPKRVRVLGIDRPDGIILPSFRIKLEIQAASGAKTRWEPEIPIPFPYAWGYRLSRWMGVPVVSSHDPEDLTFSVELPAALRRGRGGASSR